VTGRRSNQLNYDPANRTQNEELRMENGVPSALAILKPTFG
jgi:hypothetical protein